jgi:hypothetical protein
MIKLKISKFFFCTIVISACAGAKMKIKPIAFSPLPHLDSLIHRPQAPETTVIWRWKGQERRMTAITVHNEYDTSCVIWGEQKKKLIVFFKEPFCHIDTKPKFLPINGSEYPAIYWGVGIRGTQDAPEAKDFLTWFIDPVSGKVCKSEILNSAVANSYLFGNLNKPEIDTIKTNMTCYDDCAEPICIW